MQFVYKPEGVDAEGWKRWEFAPDRLLSPEAVAIERLTKLTFAEWEDAALRGSVSALHAFLYVMLKRDNPTLKPAEVVFSMKEIDLDLDDEETEAAIRNLEAQAAVEPLSPESEALLATLRAQHQSVPVVDGPAESDEDGDHIEGEGPKED